MSEGEGAEPPKPPPFNVLDLVPGMPGASHGPQESHGQNGHEEPRDDIVSRDQYEALLREVAVLQKTVQLYQFDRTSYLREIDEQSRGRGLPVRALSVLALALVVAAVLAALVWHRSGTAAPPPPSVTTSPPGVPSYVCPGPCTATFTGATGELTRRSFASYRELAAFIQSNPGVSMESVVPETASRDLSLQSVMLLHPVVSPGVQEHLDVQTLSRVQTGIWVQVHYPSGLLLAYWDQTSPTGHWSASFTVPRRAAATLLTQGIITVQLWHGQHTALNFVPFTVKG